MAMQEREATFFSGLKNFLRDRAWTKNLLRLHKEM